MLNWWVNSALEAGGPFLLTCWVVWVIGSIVLHELGHGWAAIASGDRTPIESGHMTWNPIVHMGGMSLLVFAVVGIAWGMMPVNPSRLRGRHAEAKVAFAGPLMNLGLALTAILLGGFWLALGSGHIASSYVASPEVYRHVQMFFMVGAGLNLVLAMFNLLPIPPLDGSRILAHYAPGYRDLIHGPQGQMLMLGGLALAMFLIGPRMFGVGFATARAATRAVGNLVSGGALGI